MLRLRRWYIRRVLGDIGRPPRPGSSSLIGRHGGRLRFTGSRSAESASRITQSSRPACLVRAAGVVRLPRAVGAVRAACVVRAVGVEIRPAGVRPVADPAALCSPDPATGTPDERPPDTRSPDTRSPGTRSPDPVLLWFAVEGAADRSPDAARGLLGPFVGFAMT
jgi:hypothetical protein